MLITATALKTNLGKYLMAAEKEDVFITKNGRTVAKLTAPYKHRLEIVDELWGSVPNTMTLEEAKAERLKEI